MFVTFLASFLIVTSHVWESIYLTYLYPNSKEKAFRVQGDFTLPSSSTPFFHRRELRGGLPRSLTPSHFIAFLWSAGNTVIVFLQGVVGRCILYKKNQLNNESENILNLIMNQTWTTLVRSRQSMQLILKTPFCLQMVPSLSIQQ